MMMMLLQNAAASRGLERAGEAGFASAKQEVHDSHVLVSVMVIWQTIRRKKDNDVAIRYYLVAIKVDTHSNLSNLMKAKGLVQEFYIDMQLLFTGRGSDGGWFCSIFNVQPANRQNPTFCGWHTAATLRLYVSNQLLLLHSQILRAFLFYLDLYKYQHPSKLLQFEFAW